MSDLMVSVIIPNYNHARFLEKRLDSIFNQTYQDFEVILLDDCSRDNSWDILSNYQNHPKVTHCIRNEFNSGSPFRQWEKGIELARGEWIWIAESDDFCSNNFLIELKTLISDTVGVLTCRVHVTNELGEELKAPVEVGPVFYPGTAFVKSKMSRGNHLINASAVIFKKSLVLNVNWDEVHKLKYSGDWLFWSMLLKNTDLAVSPLALSFFRRHNLSMGASVQNQFLYFKEGMEVLSWIFRNFKFNFKEKFKIFLRWNNKIKGSQLSSKDYSSVFSALKKNFKPLLLYRLIQHVYSFKRRFRYNM